MPTAHPRLPAFKAYDIRGRIPDQLNPDMARDIGRAYARLLKPRKVVVGHDMRLSSPEMTDALVEGLLGSGVDVVHIGQCGTEMIYFAAEHLAAEGVDGGICVTASHNPADYNGMKLVRAGAVPISADSGLMDIEAMVAEGGLTDGPQRGTLTHQDIVGPYIERLLGFIDTSALRPLTIVSNPGNGCAGPFVEALKPHLPCTFVELQHEPDGRFPNGVPNPLLIENRGPTIDAVKAHSADFGLAWDGDFDRCFFFDDKGGFIEGYYMVGLLATEILRSYPGGKIVHDPRLTWNTIDMVREAGGETVLCKSGHAFIKERMRAVDACYGGEMSAHHYFKDFAYCDTGMVPWLLVLQVMSRTGKSLSELVSERQAAYPCSGEINTRIGDPGAALAELRKRYEGGAVDVDLTDGLSIELAQWRFNVRMSNTEPVVRLNVESRGDEGLMRDKTDALVALLNDMA